MVVSVHCQLFKKIVAETLKCSSLILSFLALPVIKVVVSQFNGYGVLLCCDKFSCLITPSMEQVKG